MSVAVFSLPFCLSALLYDSIGRSTWKYSEQRGIIATTTYIAERRGILSKRISFLFSSEGVLER